jgi:ABC-2 type transport system ATP-binding protein
MAERCWAFEVNVQPAILLDDVRKTYKGGANALRGVSASIQPGEIFCLVGPNGAGKTTLLRIVGTQLEPTRGSVTILGIDVVRKPNEVRQHLGIVPQEAITDPELSAFEHIYYYLRARGQSRRGARESAERALHLVGLWDHRGTMAVRLSGGLRRRILIAMAISTEAEIMLLDEPTTGLDPLARRQVWHDLAALKSGRTVLLTTHSMDEAEALADRVAIFHEGRIIAVGTVPQLRGKLPNRHKIYIEDGTHGAALQRFGRMEEVAGKVVLYPESDLAIDEVVHFALTENLPVSVLPTSLEDIYIHLIKERT